MENSILSTLLSVFDFRTGPEPVYCLPQDLGIGITTQISFKGHLILSKVAQSRGQEGFPPIGLFLPFNEYNLVGFVYMFQIRTDYSYTQEQTYSSLSFLAPKKQILSFFSLIGEFLQIATKITEVITSSIQYKGEKSAFKEIEDLLKTEQIKLDKRFKERISETESDISSNKELSKKLSNFLSESKNDLEKLLYGLLIDFNQKMLIYTPKEDFGDDFIASVQLLTPHRILNIEFAGKGDMRVDPEIIVSTERDFFDLQAEFFDISIDYRSNKIVTKDFFRSKFIKDITEFVVKNKKDPALVNQLIKIEIKKLLDLYLEFILVAGALTDQERDIKRKEILETNDKELIKAAFTLATYYNPFLNEIDLI